MRQLETNATIPEHVECALLRRKGNCTRARAIQKRRHVALLSMHTRVKPNFRRMIFPITTTLPQGSHVSIPIHLDKNRHALTPLRYENTTMLCGQGSIPSGRPSRVFREKFAEWTDFDAPVEREGARNTLHNNRRQTKGTAPRAGGRLLCGFTRGACDGLLAEFAGKLRVSFAFSKRSKEYEPNPT